MKHGMEKSRFFLNKGQLLFTVGLVLFLVLFCPFLLLGSVIDESQMGTVLSIRGNVKMNVDGNWGPLKRGDRIFNGVEVLVEKRSLMRILTPKGKLIKLPEGKSVVNFIKDGKKEDISKFVGEFFSARSRTRLNAVRSGLDDLQQDWISLLNSDRMELDKVESVLELSAAYRHITKSRSDFIIWKLYDLFTENRGFQALSLHTFEGYTHPGKWKAFVKSKSSKRPIKSVDTVYSGNMLSFEFSSNVESYVYMFLTTKNISGKINTFRMFPNSDDLLELNNGDHFVSRVGPDSLLKLPASGDGFEVDDNKGMEYIWACACPGALSLRSVEQAKIEVEKFLSKRGSILDVDKLKSILPEVCGVMFAANLRHL